MKEDKSTGKIWLYIIIGIFLIFYLGDSTTSTDSGSSNSNDAPSISKSYSPSDIQIVTHNGKRSEYTDAIHVYCTVKNTTDRLASYVGVEIVCYDKNGIVIGTGIGNTANLPAYDTRVIEAIAVDVPRVNTYEVIVSTAIFK